MELIEWKLGNVILEARGCRLLGVARAMIDSSPENGTSQRGGACSQGDHTQYLSSDGLPSDVITLRDTMETLMALHRLRQLECTTSDSHPFPQTADDPESSRTDDLPCSPHHSPSPAHLCSPLNGVISLNGLNGHIGLNSCKRHLNFENNSLPRFQKIGATDFRDFL